MGNDIIIFHSNELDWGTYARRPVIPGVTKAGMSHHTSHTNHWQHISEIRWSNDVETNSTITFNEARRLIVDMFHCGKMAFTAPKHVNRRDLT